MDHGRGFGKAHHDELTILAPMYQCCMIREATLSRLLAFHNSPTASLGQTLRANLEADPVTPVLLDDHIEAVDRRVAIILQVVRDCLSQSDHTSDVIYTHDELYESGYDAVENDKAF